MCTAICWYQNVSLVFNLSFVVWLIWFLLQLFHVIYIHNPVSISILHWSQSYFVHHAQYYTVHGHWEESIAKYQSMICTLGFVLLILRMVYICLVFITFLLFRLKYVLQLYGFRFSLLPGPGKYKLQAQSILFYSEQLGTDSKFWTWLSTQNH